MIFNANKTHDIFRFLSRLSKITSNWERKSNENKIRENNKDNEMES